MRALRSFSKPEEAHLLRAHLEGNGIPAFVRDDHTVTADWTLSNAIGGVKVEVAEEDYEAALSVIAEFSPPPPSQEKRHSFARYLKLFAGSGAAIYGFLLWRSAPAPVEIYVVLLLVSLIIAACVAGFCAVLDL